MPWSSPRCSGCAPTSMSSAPSGRRSTPKPALRTASAASSAKLGIAKLATILSSDGLAMGSLRSRLALARLVGKVGGAQRRSGHYQRFVAKQAVQDVGLLLVLLSYGAKRLGLVL